MSIMPQLSAYNIPEEGHTVFVYNNGASEGCHKKQKSANVQIFVRG